MSRPAINTDSLDWRLIAKWAAGEILTATRQLEARGTSLADTEYYRGRIAALREMIDLPEPQQAVPQPTSYV